MDDENLLNQYQIAKNELERKGELSYSFIEKKGNSYIRAKSIINGNEVHSDHSDIWIATIHLNEKL